MGAMRPMSVLMTDLSQRIMDAWLERNPDPDKWETEMPYEKKIEWRHNKRYLQSQLDCEAYESAVMQFLVPEGWRVWTVDASVEGSFNVMISGPHEYSELYFATVFSPAYRSGIASTFPEALLNAIEAIDDTK